MSNDPKRYIFIDFESLKKIKVKKLQSACNKFFILINEANKSVPLSLVTKMQKLGKGVKWVPVNSETSYSLNLHIVFLLGKLHQKSDPSIEFVVISNDTEIDPIIAFINKHGRFCMRVRRGNRNVPTPTASRSKKKASSVNSSSITDNSNQHNIGMEERKKRLDLVINDSKSRLLILGDKPVAVSDLYNFLSLVNEEFANHFEMSEIVDEMAKRNDIEILEDQVKYNF